jgi:tetratricopeptide (TPR) repeat protein
MNFQKAYSLNPEKDRLLLKVGDLYRSQQKLSLAIDNYQSFLKLHPADPSVRGILAETYLDNKQYEAAINEMGTLLSAAQDPRQRYELQKDMAFATQMMGNLSKASGLYEALLSDPQAAPFAEKDLQLKSNLAIAYHQQGNYSKAIGVYKQIYYAEPQALNTYKIDRSKLGNDMALAITALGDAAYKAGDLNGALTQYGDAILYASKENYWPYLGLGNTYYGLHMEDKAAEAFAAVLEKDPNNVTAKLYATKLAMAKANQKEAGSGATSANVATLEKLAKEHPDNFDAVTTLADTYAQQGNATAAIAQYEKALVLQPQNLEALTALGTQWQKLGNFEQAKNAYLRALAINDQLPLIHYNLGIVYNELGQLDQSVRAYQKALLLNPNDGDAKYGLAITLEKQQKYQDALETYRAYTADPSVRYFKEAQDRIQLLQQALNPAPAFSPISTTQPASASKPVQGSSGATQPKAAPNPVPRQTPKRIDLF